jgi:hypothetical protein
VCFRVIASVSAGGADTPGSDEQQASSVTLPSLPQIARNAAVGLPDRPLQVVDLAHVRRGPAGGRGRNVAITLLSQSSTHPDDVFAVNSITR